MNYLEIDTTEFKENDYIYCGIRLNSKNIKIVEILHFHKNELKLCWFKYSAKLNKVIGGIYRGGETDDFKTFRGMESAKFVRQINERNVIQACHAEEYACKKELSRIKIESKYKRENPFERDLKNVKEAYDNLKLYTEKQAFIELIIKTIKGD